MPRACWTTTSTLGLRGLGLGRFFLMVGVEVFLLWCMSQMWASSLFNKAFIVLFGYRICGI